MTFWYTWIPKTKTTTFPHLVTEQPADTLDFQYFYSTLQKNSISRDKNWKNAVSRWHFLCLNRPIPCGNGYVEHFVKFRDFFETECWQNCVNCFTALQWYWFLYRFISHKLVRPYIEMLHSVKWSCFCTLLRLSVYKLVLWLNTTTGKQNPNGCRIFVFFLSCPSFGRASQLTRQLLGQIPNIYIKKTKLCLANLKSMCKTTSEDNSKML